ncbi:LOW QUALITY PROTEIN: leukocyte antigen CD37-like [Hirundo rustica]|uniref:LOW QUALITY PROTEIN: leukocyte antigen CD37-like n=1 Tax=Hirundo rustica TaxID=43150 RepID=UPI002673FCEF|nr:LOW QUALITY PROTEIN: leukocyte antigen CD37-like [Hirundo rustica]
MSPKSCLGCTKCFVFLLNLFFFFLGILLLAFSFWVLFDRQSFAAVLGSPLVRPEVLGFLGCLGALKEVKVMLGLYFGLLLLLFAAQITVAVIIYTQRAALATKVATYTEELIRGYPTQGPPGDPHESWDAVQQQLGCCGWKGPQDWDHHDDATRDEVMDRAIACSCLVASNSTQKTPWMLPHGRCPTAAPHNIFPRGCKERVQTWLAGNLVTIVGVCIGIGLGELSLLMLSMFLVQNLDSRYEKLLRGF